MLSCAPLPSALTSGCRACPLQSAFAAAWSRLLLRSGLGRRTTISLLLRRAVPALRLLGALLRSEPPKAPAPRARLVPRSPAHQTMTRLLLYARWPTALCVSSPRPRPIAWSVPAFSVSRLCGVPAQSVPCCPLAKPCLYVCRPLNPNPSPAGVAAGCSFAPSQAVVSSGHPP
ncbi:MAG: hypothetical protein J3K34DRAFT_447015 [Monoraphidium minutum]|nr:MAG: hypothetical protein J3K34DRAFT_447015 [Monoraphidium minutum]